MEPREAQRQGPPSRQPQRHSEDERHRSLPPRPRRGGEDARARPRGRRAQADEGLVALDVGAACLRASWPGSPSTPSSTSWPPTNRWPPAWTSPGRPRTKRRWKCPRAPTRARASRSRRSTPASPSIRTSRRCWRPSTSSAIRPCRAVRTRRRRRRTASTPTATARTWPGSSSAAAATRPTAAWPAWRPQASLVSVRVLDGTGRGLTSDVLAGLQWVLDNKTQYGIRVVNLSLGHPVYEPAAVDPLVQAVDALWDAGVVVVCSAGNNGRDGLRHDQQPLQLAQGDHGRRDQRPPDGRRLGRHDHDLFVARPDGHRPRGQARPRRSRQPDRLPALGGLLPGPALPGPARRRRPRAAGRDRVLRDVRFEHGLPHRRGHGGLDARAGPFAQPGHDQGPADDVRAEARRR